MISRVRGLLPPSKPPLPVKRRLPGLPDQRFFDAIYAVIESLKSGELIELFREP